MPKLETLYLGDVRPSERSFRRDSQQAKAPDDLVKAVDTMTDTLTEKKKERFEAYMTARREVNVLTDCETLIYAFRLAARIVIDVLTDGQSDILNMQTTANHPDRGSQSQRNWHVGVQGLR